MMKPPKKSTNGRKNGTNAEAPRKVSFGSVTIEVAPYPKKDWDKNVLAGQKALARAKGALIRKGIDLKAPKGVPFYHLDPNDPDVMIRVLDGKSVRGRFNRGRFVPLENGSR